MRQGRAPKFKFNMIRMSVSVEPEVNKWLVSKGYGEMSSVVNNLCRDQMKIENWVEEKAEELINPVPINTEVSVDKLIEEKQNFDEEIGERDESRETVENKVQ